MKNKQRILSFILSCSILLSMSGCNQGKNKDQNSIKVDYIEEIDEDIIDRYSRLVDNVNVTYNYSYYYPSNEYIDSLIGEVSMFCCSYQMNEDLDIEIENLLLKIGDNSKKFVNDNEDYYLEKKDDDYLSRIDIMDILENVLKGIFYNATNDIKEDFCYLQNIRIAFIDRIELEAQATFLPEEMLIKICYPNLLSGFYQKVEMGHMDDSITSFYNFLYTIVAHEINHVRQMKCEHREIKDKNNDVSYLRNYVSTIIESSAESALYNQHIVGEMSNSYYIYLSERIDESLLFLLALDRTSINGYYNAIFNSDGLALCRYFNLNTKEEMETFYRMLYAIDSMNSRTDLLSKCDPNQETMSIGEIHKLVGFDYRADLFKILIKRLMLYTKNNSDFSLEENIYLFIIILNNMIQDTYLVEKNEEGEYVNVFDKRFLENIETLEEIYLNFLSEYYIISRDELNTMINNLYYLDSNIIDKLMKRFPMLMVIDFVKPINMYSYELYVNEKDKSLKKLKRVR